MSKDKSSKENRDEFNALKYAQLLADGKKRVLNKNGIIDRDFIVEPIGELGDISQSKTVTVLITPDIARELLDRASGERQRKVSNATVKRYAEEMRNGDWEYNHVTIKQDCLGEIADGRHRLLAVIEANYPLITDMVKGAQPTIIDTVDSGRPRSLGDAVSMHTTGLNNHVMVGKAARFLFHFKNGRYASHSSKDKTRFTKKRLKEFIDYNLDVILELDRISEDVRSTDNPVRPKHKLAALGYAFKLVDEAKGQEFIEKLIYGFGLTKESPITYVRNRLMDSIQTNAKYKKIGHRSSTMLIIKAWNDFYIHDDVMQGSKYGQHDKKMPKVAGLDYKKLYIKPKSWDDHLK